MNTERWLDESHPLRKMLVGYFHFMREKKHHVSLDYKENGEAIMGLKRCRFCGLSCTYWERFPVCEFQEKVDGL